MSAIVSEDLKYRYWLTREWAEGPTQVFIMLNPSTADANNDDPTIRRCVSFAKREGAGGLVVVNLFAYRATDPKELGNIPDPVGPLNEHYLYKALDLSSDSGLPVICAWGAAEIAKPQARLLVERQLETQHKLACLGWTKAGSPRHPLYVKGDAPLTPWEVLEE